MSDQKKILEQKEDGVSWDFDDITSVVQTQLPSALGKLGDEAKGLILTKVVEGIPKLIAKFVPGLGIVSSIKSLYDLVTWLLEQGQDPKSGINKLLKSLIKSFTDATNNNVPNISSNVNTAIQASLETVIGAILKAVLPGVDFKGLVDTAKQTAHNVVAKASDAVVGAIAAPVGKVLGKVFPEDAAMGSKIPGKKLTRPIVSKDGKTKAWLQIEAAKVIVVVSQSPLTDATDSKQPEIQSVLQQLKTDGAGLNRQLEAQAKAPNPTVSAGATKAVANANAKNKLKPSIDANKKVEMDLSEFVEKYKGPSCSTGSCFTAEIPSRNGDASLTLMRERELGQKVQSFLPGNSGYAESGRMSEVEANPTAHRAIWFILESMDGEWVKFGFLKSLFWVEQSGACEVGAKIDFNLPEMGVEGTAQVMSIEPCPTIEPGPGALVTGVFQHSAGEIWEVWVEGEPKPIRTTEQHPFWSVERNDWVPACDLREGECLSGVNGPRPVQKVEYTGRTEPVFNLEVDADHCYRVGEQGILVHNASGPKAHCPHYKNEKEEDRQRINKDNSEYYLDTVKAGSRILQIAAGTNVYEGALALDLDPKDGYTAVMALSTESYNNMPWFKSVKFDRVIIVSALNDPVTNKDYSWIFENARHILTRGGKLELHAPRAKHDSLQYVRNADVLKHLV